VSEPRGKARSDLKVRAWKLRQRGWTQQRIAESLGVDQGNVSRWLDALDKAELERLAPLAERQKVFQNALLGLLVDESLQAWERSKKPRTKVSRRLGDVITDQAGKPLKAPSGEDLRKPSTDITEIVERDGDPAWIDRVIKALAELRQLWGLNVAEATNDKGPIAFADVMQRIKEASTAYDEKPKAIG
jgi:predicted transcriptional regulator